MCGQSLNATCLLCGVGPFGGSHLGRRCHRAGWVPVRTWSSARGVVPAWVWAVPALGVAVTATGGSGLDVVVRLSGGSALGVFVSASGVSSLGRGRQRAGRFQRWRRRQRAGCVRGERGCFAAVVSLHRAPLGGVIPRQAEPCASAESVRPRGASGPATSPPHARDGDRTAPDGLTHPPGRPRPRDRPA